MTSAMDKDEIEKRIKALKATALNNGAESTGGLWILLYINAKARKHLAVAVSLLELLGISEDAMVQHFGKSWKKKLFTKHNCGFIHREFYGCTFVSVQTCADEIECNVPDWTNIITRGSEKVETVHDYLTKKVAASSKEDGVRTNAKAKAVNHDVIDMKERDVSVDDLNGKVLQDIFSYLRVDGMKRKLSAVNCKWRRAVLDADPSPEDYVASLREDHIPITIEILGQQKEQEIGLNHIFTG